MPRLFRPHRLAAAVVLVVGGVACGNVAFDGGDGGGDTRDGGELGDAASDGGISDGAVSADATPPGPDAGVPKRVFVTASTYGAGQLASSTPVFATADALCDQAATHFTDAGTSFKAWISDGTVSAADRKVFNPPYEDITGFVTVFTADGGFSAAGLESDQGLTPPASWWTGMKTTTQIGETCSSWTALTGYGSVGRAQAWYGSDSTTNSPCMGGFAALICFEQ